MNYLGNISNNMGEQPRPPYQNNSKCNSCDNKMLGQSIVPSNHCEALNDFIHYGIDIFFDNNKVSYEKYKIMGVLKLSLNPCIFNLVPEDEENDIEEVKIKLINPSKLHLKQHLDKIHNLAINKLNEMVEYEEAITEEVLDLFKEAKEKIDQKQEEAKKWIDEIYSIDFALKLQK